MELQSQHGTSGSLVVIQQPSLDSRQRLEYEREVQPATILSLDQIKVLRNRNEYTEGPSMVRKHGPKTAPRHSKPERTHEIIPVNVNNNNEHRVLTWLTRDTCTLLGLLCSVGPPAQGVQQVLVAQIVPPRNRNFWDSLLHQETALDTGRTG